MTAFTALISILTALLVGAMSPGPSFLVVAKRSISGSRADGLASAAGMGAGAIVFAGIALCGLYALVTALGHLFIFLKVAGGAYLLFMGYTMWRGATQPMTAGTQPSFKRQHIRHSFWQGFATQTSNPKTAIVYGSVFAAFLPHDAKGWWYIALPPLVFIVEAGWYALVAISLSREAPRKKYIAFKTWIDRIAAGVMSALGIRLILAAFKQ